MHTPPPHITRSQLLTMIEDAAHNLLFGKAARGSDGFRQWYYTRHYQTSTAATDEAKTLMVKGHSATDIAEILYKRHA